MNMFEPPKVEKPAPPPTRDAARELADQRDAAGKRKGRAAQVLYGSKARTLGHAASALGG